MQKNKELFGLAYCSLSVHEHFHNNCHRQLITINNLIHKHDVSIDSKTISLDTTKQK